MTIVLALFFLGAGLALIVNTILSPHDPTPEFSQGGAMPIRNRRILSATVGAIIALGGAVLVLLSRAEPM